ncbi:MAG: TolC family protein [Paracoccaceae bacterium]
MHCITKRGGILAAACAIGALAGCQQATGRASDERLAELLDTGLDQATVERTERRLDAVLTRDNATGALAEDYAALVPSEGAALAPLVAAALERNPRIGRAAQDINAAGAARLNAIFGYLPQLSVRYQQEDVAQTVSESDNEVFRLGEAEFPVTTLAVELRQPLLDLAAIFGIQFATNARTRAEVDYIRTVRDVSYDVMDAYLVAGQARARMDSLSSRQSVIAGQIGNQATLAQLGLDSGSEGASLRSERASLAAQESAEAARYAEALGDLSRLTGQVVRSVAAPTVPAGIAGAERRIGADAAVEQGLTNNPAIMSAALGVTGSELQRRQALAEDFAPVIEAYAILEEQEREGSRFGGGSVTEDQTVGVRLTIPLFNARGEGYDTFGAIVGQRVSALDYYGQRSELEAEIRATHDRLGRLTAAIGQTGQAAADARRAVATERARVAAGESVEMAVSSRQLRLNTAEEQLAFYRIEYVRAWARLQYLMGLDLARERL